MFGVNNNYHSEIEMVIGQVCKLLIGNGSDKEWETTEGDSEGSEEVLSFETLRTGGGDDGLKDEVVGEVRRWYACFPKTAHWRGKVVDGLLSLNDNDLKTRIFEFLPLLLLLLIWLLRLFKLIKSQVCSLPKKGVAITVAPIIFLCSLSNASAISLNEEICRTGGVVCDVSSGKWSGNVTSLNFSSSQLAGSIPSFFSLFLHL
jgi:hypothetical protein